MFSQKFYNSEHKIFVNQVLRGQHWACPQGAWNIPSSLIQLTPHLRYQEGAEPGTQYPLSNVPLKGSLERKGAPGSQTESRGRMTERLQGLILRDRELSKPWHGPGPHLTPGAARSWTCSRCAALHLAWETAHIWGDQLASEGAPTPTNYLNKLENTAEPSPSGQCVSQMSGHCGSHVVRNYHLTGTAARYPKRELQTHAEQQRHTWSRSRSAILCHHAQPGHS